ncbi:tumor necrosis factor receptor superfamily member 16-like isoform X2 [Branchiostoma floridae x Branchiostoma japonicum]
MMSKASLILFVPAFVIGAESTSQDKRPEKWRHIDPLSGTILFCDWCEPGFYMNRVCTERTATECLPCPWDVYTEHYNREYECRRCSDCRRVHEHVKIECSATNNRICQCDDGYYRLFEFCLLHKKCPIGHGVTKQGTPEKDTKCSRCKTGTFSSTMSATEPCKSHTNCSVWDECVVRRGNRRMDNLCGTCVTNGTVADARGTNTPETVDNATIATGNVTTKNNVSVGVIQPKFSNPGLFALIVLIAVPIGLIVYFVFAITKKDTPLPCRVRTSSSSCNTAAESEGTTLMSRCQPLTHCPDQQPPNDTNTENTQLLLRGAAGMRYRAGGTDSVDGRETSQSRSPHEDLLGMSLTLDHVGHISGEVGDLWRQLAREQLGFSDGNCDGFNHDYQLNGQREIVYQMLRAYVRREESQPPTVGDLSDALENVGLRHVAEKLLTFARNGSGQNPSS